MPYWGPYLQHLGFGPLEIGELMAVFMATRVVAPLLGGWLADRSGRPVVLVRVTTALTVVIFAGNFLGTSYATLALVMGLFSFTYAATLAPFEAVTLRHLGAAAERYGLVRLWGSLGFILAVVILGVLLERFGIGWLLPGGLVCFGALALTALTLPRAVPVERRPARGPFGAVLREPRVVALLLVAVLVQASHGPYYTFFSIHAEQHGYTKDLVGLLWALGVVAEIGVFLLAPRLFARWRPRALLLAALLLTALRWVLVAEYVDRVLILTLSQLLHAASFALFHAVAIHLVNRWFVGPHQARGQALYSACGFGVGGALGSLASGYTWTVLGPEATFLAAAALPVVACGVAALWIPRAKLG